MSNNRHAYELIKYMYAVNQSIFICKYSIIRKIGNTIKTPKTIFRLLESRELIWFFISNLYDFKYKTSQIYNPKAINQS